MNVLVVEDERNLAAAIVRILSDAGYNAEAVYDGTSGLTSAKSGLYDAIVLDVMLPGMNGYDVVHELRHASISTPVLMLTALNTGPRRPSNANASSRQNASSSSAIKCCACSGVVDHTIEHQSCWPSRCKGKNASGP